MPGMYLGVEKKFGAPVDFQKNEARNVRVQNLGTAPGTPVSGQLYYDTAANRLYYYNGTAWTASDGSSVALSTIAPTTIVPDAAAAVGTGTAVSREDHTHGIAAAVAGASAVGDVATEGTSTSFARADHLHGREGFGAVSAQTAFGATSGNGTATTLPRSDHTHGTPAHDNAAHSTIPLSALATATANLNIGGFKLVSVSDGTADTDAVNVAQLNAARRGLDLKDSVRVATTAALPGNTRTGNVLTASANGALAAIDGVTLVVNDRLLVKNEATGANNGLYYVSDVGSATTPWTLTRTADADSDAEVTAGLTVFVSEGTDNGNERWTLTTDDPITLNTTALTFAQESGGGEIITAGAGLTKTGTTLDVGAGTGVSVTADAVAVDTAVVVRKFAASVGDGTATAYTVTHNLGTQDVTVGVYRNATPWEEVEVDVEHDTVNTVIVRFATAPTASQFRVVVHG